MLLFGANSVQQAPSPKVALVLLLDSETVNIEATATTGELRLFEGSESTEAISFGGVSTPLIWTTMKDIKFEIVICGLSIC